MNTLLFAAAEAVQTKTEIIAEGLVGIAVVLGILFTLTIIIAVVSSFFKERPKAATAPAAAAPVASAPAVAVAPVASGISDAHLKVVIAAAVHAVLSCRTQNLQLAPGDSAWADEGRRSIFQSRKLR
jgi:Na+-transporting methylmalonyl-CoA/oxaloacetate decarboxylase gamma subunit